jgi:cyclo(L-tyrosyl-L-tyrosyl) synthase
MKIVPLTSSCQNILDIKEHICFGISPYNSLFSEEYLTALITYAQNHFRTFHFFLPDTPTLFTLEAMGYSPAECQKKLKKQINWLRNKIQKSFERFQLDYKNHLIDDQFLQANLNFKTELNQTYQAYDQDPLFRQLCLESSRWVLQNKLPTEDITEQTLYHAVKYFLYEIPIFAATNKILDIETSLFCYHQSIPFHHQLYKNQLIYPVSDGQGYGQIILPETHDKK